MNKNKRWIIPIAVLSAVIIVALCITAFLYSKNMFKNVIHNIQNSDSDNNVDNIDDSDTADVVEDDDSVSVEAEDSDSDNTYISKYDHSNLLDISAPKDVKDIPEYIDMSNYPIDWIPEYDFADEDEYGYSYYWIVNGPFGDFCTVRTENASDGYIEVREFISDNACVSVTYRDGEFDYCSYEQYSDKWDIVLYGLYNIDGHLENVQVVTTRYYNWGKCQETIMYLDNGEIIYNYYHMDYDGNTLEETNIQH